MASDEEFSVWVFLPDGYHYALARYVSAKAAVHMAKRATLVIAARIVITDGGDHCVFEWQRDEEVTWPTNAN
ncbi:MAG TPA: hypothetical protein VKB76_05045 [Ktedonobacterales bacterium]|nr:hypothetical protein [Ktedonobacterales bacterium]